MAKQKTLEKQMPWEDRWAQPTLDQLLEPFRESGKAKLLETLIERFHGFEHVESHLTWHGDAWKWTLQFDLLDGRRPAPVMAYMVFDPIQAVVCIPLEEDEILAMPVRRLNRYIRDGMRSAKIAVEQHWCQWSPSANTEVDHLTDLFKRKHKGLTAEPK